MSRSRKTRISIIILHLTVADLFVTFILIPTEVSWSGTDWKLVKGLKARPHTHTWAGTSLGWKQGIKIWDYVIVVMA